MNERKTWLMFTTSQKAAAIFSAGLKKKILEEYEWKMPEIKFNIQFIDLYTALMYENRGKALENSGIGFIHE